MKTLPVLKSILVVADAVVAEGIVNLKRFAVISPVALIELAFAAPKFGVTKVGVFSFTTNPVPVVPIVLNAPEAAFATIPLTFNPVKFNPVKVGALVVAIA